MGSCLFYVANLLVTIRTLRDYRIFGNVADMLGSYDRTILAYIREICRMVYRIKPRNISFAGLAYMSHFNTNDHSIVLLQFDMCVGPKYFTTDALALAIVIDKNMSCSLTEVSLSIIVH